MMMYLVLINKKQRGGLGGTHGGPIYRAKRERERESRANLAWLGGTRGGPIYRAKRERERVGRTWLGLAWRDSWRSHLQGKERERESGELGLAGLVAVPSTGQRERVGRTWLGLAGLVAVPSAYMAKREREWRLGGRLGGPINEAERERERCWRLGGPINEAERCWRLGGTRGGPSYMAERGGRASSGGTLGGPRKSFFSFRLLPSLPKTYLSRLAGVSLSPYRDLALLCLDSSR